MKAKCILNEAPHFKEGLGKLMLRDLFYWATDDSNESSRCPYLLYEWIYTKLKLVFSICVLQVVEMLECECASGLFKKN